MCPERQLLSTRGKVAATGSGHGVWAAPLGAALGRIAPDPAQLHSQHLYGGSEAAFLSHDLRGEHSWRTRFPFSRLL